MIVTKILDVIAKNGFWAKKYLRFSVTCPFAARRAVSWDRLPKMAQKWHKKLPFWCPVVMVTKSLDAVPKKLDFGPKKCIFGPKISFSFSTLRPNNPLISPQMDPTQWDHIIPMS